MPARLQPLPAPRWQPASSKRQAAALNYGGRCQQGCRRAHGPQRPSTIRTTTNTRRRPRTPSSRCSSGDPVCLIQTWPSRRPRCPAVPSRSSSGTLHRRTHHRRQRVLILLPQLMPHLLQEPRLRLLSGIKLLVKAIANQAIHECIGTNRTIACARGCTHEEEDD